MKNHITTKLAWLRSHQQQLVGYCIGATYYFWLLDNAATPSKITNCATFNLEFNGDFATLGRQLRNWLNNQSVKIDNVFLTIPSELVTITSQTIPREWSWLARRQFLNMNRTTYTAPIICKHLFISSPAADAPTILLQATLEQQTLDRLSSSLSPWQIKNLTLIPLALARGITALNLNQNCTCGLIFVTERLLISLTLTKNHQFTWENIEVSSREELKRALQTAATHLEAKVKLLLLDGNYQNLPNFAADLVTKVPLIVVPTWLKTQNLISETLPTTPSLMTWGLVAKSRVPWLNFAFTSSKQRFKILVPYLCGILIALCALSGQSYLLTQQQKPLIAEETRLTQKLHTFSQSPNYSQLAKAVQLLKKFDLPAVYTVKIKLDKDRFELSLMSPSKKRLERLIKRVESEATTDLAELIPGKLYGLSVETSFK